jgi:hypothetical protein
VQQHLLLILKLFDQERVTCNICVVQQYYSLQMGLYFHAKETLVSFYVHQHSCSKLTFVIRRKGLVLLFVCSSINS